MTCLPRPQMLEREMVHVFKPLVQPGQVLFKLLPPGNERPLISLPRHYVIDVGLLPINNVHVLMALQGEECTSPEAPTGGPGSGSDPSGERSAAPSASCSCTRDLLVTQMAHAVAARPGAPRLDALYRRMMRQYMDATRDAGIQNLPPGQLSTAPQSGERGGAPPAYGRTAVVEQTADVAIVGAGVEVVEEGAGRAPDERHPIIQHEGLREALQNLLCGPHRDNLSAAARLRAERSRRRRPPRWRSQGHRRAQGVQVAE